MGAKPASTCRNSVPDTIETVWLDPETDILMWVEDAAPAPKMWDAHVGEPGGFQEPAAQLSEVDFMDAALEDFRRNGCPGLHEDPNDTRDWRDKVPGYRAPYYL